jgi:hypothetical protein
VLKSLIFLILLFFAIPIGAFNLSEGFNIENSPRLVKIKIPFDSSKADIGISQAGYIEDAQNKINLKPLTKYRIKLNALGNYDLCLIQNGEIKEIIKSLNLPIVLTSQMGNQPIYFNGHWYRGNIKVLPSENGFIAVNNLDIECAILAILGPMTRINDSVGAIKAATIIIRSSLFTLTFTHKDIYHINGFNLNYHGLDGEKEFVNKLVKETQAEVLFNANGELLFTPIKTAAIIGAAPFEMIGQSKNAWEKNFTLQEIEEILLKNNFKLGHIKNVKTQELTAVNVNLPLNDSLFVYIQGDSAQIQLPFFEAQQIFKLPSPNFRVYSFAGQDGQTNLQFIGNLPSSWNDPTPPILNIVRAIYELTKPNADYKQILTEMYPQSYLGKI